MRFASATLLLLLPCQAQTPARKTPEYTYKIVKAYPHDRSAFTQGLEFHNGFLYEGTGLNGKSTLRKVRIEDGQVLQKIDLSAEYFGEGITLVGGEIVQITYQTQTGFVYGLNDFTLRRKFKYVGEGWGLTNNGREIFFSDGSAEIRVLDPKTLAEKRRIKVHDGAKPIDQLNELEWVEGELFANIWGTDRIARIAPQTGAVTGWVDLAGILSPMYRTQAVDVLNGIAYDAAKKRLFVTGKLWPLLYEIQLIPKSVK
jgi:glutaminyl-peptide cyclotransferase